jgi:hypothetical protein
MGSRRKARIVSCDVGMEGYQDATGLGSNPQISQNAPFLFRTEFQQPEQLQKAITLKPLIVLRCANNSWKEERHFYNFSSDLQVRF